MILFIDPLKTPHTHTYGHTKSVRTNEFREVAENKINI